MKKLVILSDTHGSSAGMRTLSSLFAENDYIVHLGDGGQEVREVRREYPEKVYACAGNCDLYSALPDEGELELEQVKILYCHGHRYGVKENLYRLAEEGKRRGCQVVLYGHTHVSQITEIDGVTLINPGSLRYEPGKGGGYCYLVINGKQFTPVLVGESLW